MSIIDNIQNTAERIPGLLTGKDEEKKPEVKLPVPKCIFCNKDLDQYTKGGRGVYRCVNLHCTWVGILRHLDGIRP